MSWRHGGQVRIERARGRHSAHEADPDSRRLPRAFLESKAAEPLGWDSHAGADAVVPLAGTPLAAARSEAWPLAHAHPMIHPKMAEIAPSQRMSRRTKTHWVLRI